MVCVGSKRYLGRIVAAALITMLAGCGSPEKRSQDYYERGMALLEKNDDLNARVALSTSLKFNSNRLDALRALAGIDERLKDTGALFQVLRRIVELDPKDFDARLRLAKILFANNGNDAALKLLDAATAEDKGRADYHALRAAVLFKAGDLAGAVRDAEQTIRLEPGNFDALMVLASAQVARGDVDAALQMISQLPSASQDDTRVLALKVAIYGRKRDLVQTEATLKKLVDSKPEFREQLVNLYVEQRRLDEAEKELRTAAADSSADVATNLRLVRFLASFRSPAAAQEQLESRIKAGGDVFPYQMSLADLDYLQGNLDQARCPGSRPCGQEQARSGLYQARQYGDGQQAGFRGVGEGPAEHRRAQIARRHATRCGPGGWSHRRSAGGSQQRAQIARVAVDVRRCL